MTEFTNFLETIAVTLGLFFNILGDFNIPWDKQEDPERKCFASLLNSFGLVQHVEEQTHSRGHAIDFIISKKQDNTIVNHAVGELIPDHHLICAYFKFKKPRFSTKVIKYRKLKCIDPEALSRDIADAGLHPSTDDDIQTALDRYTHVLSEILDKHAPEKQCKITVRPKQPWYYTQTKTAKQGKRKSELKWRALRRKLHKINNSIKKAAMLQNVGKAK